jgi:hypothetical protein
MLKSTPDDIIESLLEQAPISADDINESQAALSKVVAVNRVRVEELIKELIGVLRKIEAGHPDPAALIKETLGPANPVIHQPRLVRGR